MDGLLVDRFLNATFHYLFTVLNPRENRGLKQHLFLFSLSQSTVLLCEC